MGLAFHRATKEVKDEPTKDLCCRPGAKDLNDLWNDLVEKVATGPLGSLRTRKVGDPNPISVEPIKGIKEKTRDALFHLFATLRIRHPDIPASWGGPEEKEYLDTIRDEAGYRAQGHDWNRKFQLMLLVISEKSTPKLAITDWTLFPLEPIDTFGVMCTPRFHQPERSCLWTGGSRIRS